MAENSIYEEVGDSQIVLPEDENPFRNEIKTSPNIKLSLTGVTTFLEKNHAKTKFFTTNEMVADGSDLIHSGFIFSAANYAALVAINEEFCVTINARINFYGPIKLGEIVEFDARAYFDESRKREVRVIGKLHDMKVFEGTFQLVALEEHIFLAQQKNIQREGAIRRAKERQDKAN
ncbi:PaaI family thioesterase [Campylobacter sp. RM9344]|uniref:PaaI family thioesterase n=1 Tax=Campylobacter californiensis TaxID=1032243 RepID=A0AAW3ZVR5_9BACT|nr:MULTISPECIES: PaaI family thioesterase [unclassified Campylobacter]MBE2985390.1 PaaI family thioesterase [Campylobacter sp. RM6883]MBE2987161.1 PaaI family thioesterase [Campylobacter sp. RM12919]MBE2987656.1 PaaI family thioesterase [Campylobacter sp. RM12920]MBE2995970.1 PaaI family thioesterase [Campylobacter sp. RM6913]MBE3022299.1 PaaI family thioesterase [Campylobacter sp. 7477a]MBE3029281.1 PaaI family thioesterase [Campylobacter sp. RM9344]